MTTRTCNVDKNKAACGCTFTCSRKGICCECVEYHRSKEEMPGCYFPKDAEKTGDRSVASFVNIVKQKGSGYLR